MLRTASWTILAAPLGIFGLVAQTWAEAGAGLLFTYGRLLVNSLSAVALMLVIVLPAIYAAAVRSNPYPLLCRCLRDSALTAFLTRSSAANIPMNLALCRALKLDDGLSSIAISLGAVINMPGAAVTLATLTSCAVLSAGMPMNPGTMAMIAILSAAGTAAAAGVPNGALMLAPLTAELMGVSSEAAAGMMAAGMVISVLQDAAGTALNSMSDVWAALVLEKAAERR